MELNQIRAPKNSKQARRRVGRGTGGGRGKTCGKGMKGQKSRSGVAIKGFEGGQMPIYMRLPKVGFTNKFAKRYATLTIMRLNEIHKSSPKLLATKLSQEDLQKVGIINKVFDGVRLIGNQKAEGKFQLEIHSASKGAKAAVEKAGGSLTLMAKKKTAEKKVTEKKVTEKKATEKKTAEAKPIEAKPTEAKTKETKPAPSSKATPKKENKKESKKEKK